MNGQIDLTIKPTMNCNMHCKHCFNGNVFSYKDHLDEYQVYTLMEKACKEYEKIKIIFHGGEPTLAGIDFYRNIFKKQQELKDRYNSCFNNVITTNGLLLTDEFIDLFIYHNVQINISFDGPYNNILRQHTEEVKRNIFKIRDKGGKFRCFCTISKDSVSHLQEIYEWFRDNNLHFKTLPIEKRGFAKINEEIIMNPEELASQFEKIYRYWITDKKCKISYSTMEEFAGLRREVQYKKFWFGRKIALNSDGLLYVFGRPNDVNYCLGKPSEIENISSCFKREEYTSYLKKLEDIRKIKCPNCDSRITCGGVNINIAYLYVDEVELVDYSCFQATLIDKYILNVNDEIIVNCRNGNCSIYNDFIQEKFSSYIS